MSTPDLPRKEALAPLAGGVGLGLIAAAVVAATVSLRGGGYLLAALVAALACGRAFAPVAVMKPLVIRSRWFDVSWLATVSVALAFMFATTPQLP